MTTLLGQLLTQGIQTSVLAVDFFCTSLAFLGRSPYLDKLKRRRSSIDGMLSWYVMILCIYVERKSSDMLKTKSMWELKPFFLTNQVFMRILQHLLPGAPRSLLELRFACFGRISRSSRGNCACTQRWQTWRHRGGGWQHWRRQRCWSRLGRTCPGSSAARSEVQSSKWGPRLETAWHRAPEIIDLGCNFLKMCSQFDCEVWTMNKKLCPGWSRCP